MSTINFNKNTFKGIKGLKPLLGQFFLIFGNYTEYPPMETIEVYKPKNTIRFVTAASLFDGHDATINIMRRILQSSGAEVIHLGHNRSVEEVVNCAIQEDVQGIAMTSYQGGHNEYFRYMFDLLKEKGAGHIKIFAGGGGVILPTEIKELQNYGIAKIFICPAPFSFSKSNI